MTSPGQDHYETLGLDPSADAAAIRRSYLDLMRRFHPDRSGAAAHERAQRITVAYEVLRDPRRRALYDQERSGRSPVALRFAEAPVAEGGKPRPQIATFTLFLFAVLGTGGLAYWSLSQHNDRVAQPAPQASVMAAADVPAERTVHPPPEKQVTRLANSPDVPARTGQASLLPPAPAVSIPLGKAQPYVAPAEGQTVPTDPPQSTIDLAELDRHRVLLEQQSLRFADEGKRTRLRNTGETFGAALATCSSDPCRRDLYLRRNQEITDIMRD